MVAESRPEYDEQRVVHVVAAPCDRPDRSSESARSDPAFTLLYRTSYSRLVAQMTPVAGSVPEAEDVVQEAFVRAAQHWPHIAAYEDPEGWVRRVALNLAISAVRRAVRSAAVWTRLVSGLSRTLAHPSVEASQIDRLHLIEALRVLPAKYRTVLALHHLLDHDVETIAAALRISPNTVKTRLARGRARLRVQLDLGLADGAPGYLNGP